MLDKLRHEQTKADKANVQRSMEEHAITAYKIDENEELASLITQNQLGTGELKINERNIAYARLFAQLQLKIVFDTGATKTLISEEVVNNCILSKLKRRSIEKIELYTGTGQLITAESMIYVPLEIQGYQFYIPFLICSNLTNKITVVGSDVLRQIHAIIDVNEQKIRFTIKPVKYKSCDNYKIPPKSKMRIKIGIPDARILADNIILPVKVKDTYSPLKFHNNQAEIEINNWTDNEVNFRKGDTISEAPNNVVLVPAPVPCSNINNNFKQTNFTIRNSSNETNDPSCIQHEKQPTGKVEEQEKIHKTAQPQNREDSQILRNLDVSQTQRYLERRELYPWLEESDARLYKEVNQIIDDSFKFNNTILTEKQQKQVLDIVKSHSDCFSIFEEIGKIKDYEVTIPFKEHEPFSLRSYPINPKHRTQVEKELKRLIALGVLEENSDVTNISPGFAVAKSDGKSVRIVIDNRLLNSHMHKDVFPMTHFELLLKYIGDTDPKFISKLDITAAFYSLMCSEETKKKMGVIIDQKIYRLNGLAQGASNSTKIFTRVMDQILRKHPEFKQNIHIYVDDLIICHKELKDHLASINLLLDILQQAGVKLNLSKSIFCAKSLDILGHIFENNQKDGFQITVEKKRIDAITKIDTPKTKKQLRAFLGSANFLSNNLPYFRKIAHSLYQLTSPKAKFKFEKIHEDAFEQVKNLIKSPAVTYLPKANSHKILICDSSELGYGACLKQENITDDGTVELQPIGYDSRSYGSRKFRSSMHFELFGVTNAIQNFRYLLFQNHFTVYTDSLSLVKLMRGQKPIEDVVILRLIEKLKNFSFDLKHLRATESKDMQLADTLSRLPIQDQKQDDDKITPIALPSMLSESMPEGDEIILTTDSCLYNLRKNTKPPVRFRDEDSDSDSNSETEKDEIAPPNPSNKVIKETEEQTKTNKKQEFKPNEIDIPAYLTNPPKRLFEEISQDEVIIRHVPKQLQINKFLNEILECARQFTSEPIGKQELIGQQKDSRDWRDIYKFLKWHTLPPSKLACRKTMALAEEYALIDEVLCHIRYQGTNKELQVRIVIPNDDLAIRLINAYHTSKLINHLAVSALYKILNAKYMIKNLLPLLTTVTSACIECELSKKPQPEGTGHDFHICLRKSNQPYQQVYLDILTLYQSPNNDKYALIVVDSYSRFLTAKPIKDRSTPEILNALLEIFCQHGFPELIYSDLEGAMTSKLTKVFLNFFNLEVRFCLSKSHESHGIVERAMSRLTQRLKFLLINKQEHWPTLIHIAAFSANIVRQVSNYSAFQLLYGRQPRIINPITLPEINFNLPGDEREYMENLKEKFEIADKAVRLSEWVTQIRQVSAHRSNIKKMKCLSVMDLVYIVTINPKHNYLATPSQKLTFSLVGPVVIQEICQRQRNFTLISLENKPISLKFHVNRIRPAKLQIGSNTVSNLPSLIEQIRSKGITNKEQILETLIKTQQSILKANPDMENSQYDPIPEMVNDQTQDQHVIYAEEQPTSEGKILKMKWQNGELMALIQTNDEKLNHWWPCQSLPGEVIKRAKESKMRITGSLTKYKKQLSLM